MNEDFHKNTAAQTLLFQLHYYHGAIDGRWGPLSQAAVTAWAKDQAAPALPRHSEATPGVPPPTEQPVALAPEPLTGLRIVDGWLTTGTRIPYPAERSIGIPLFVVEHFTSGGKADTSIAYWKTPDARGAEAHIIIDRDGTIDQLRPFDEECDHAGESQWTDPRTGKLHRYLNQCSVGIEYANAGDGANGDGTAFVAHKFFCPAGVVLLKHKHGGPTTYWESFPEAQIAAGIAVTAALVAHYDIHDIVGHDDIAPNRKNDPGPAFPMSRLRKACGFAPRV